MDCTEIRDSEFGLHRRCDLIGILEPPLNSHSCKEEREEKLSRTFAPNGETNEYDHTTMKERRREHEDTRGGLATRHRMDH